MPQFTTAKAELLAAMRTLGIATITVEFVGEGDSGDIDSIICVPTMPIDRVAAKTAIDAFTDPILRSDRHIGNDIKDAAAAFADEMISTYAGGYENNEGGGGTIIFDAPNDCITMDWYCNELTQIQEEPIEF